MSRVIDADAHVVEGASIAGEALKRWPDKMAFRAEEGGRGGFFIEGRRYPEFEGPGAGCPPEHGMTTATEIHPHSVDGMLADADREGIEKMVLFPSLGLAVPSFTDLTFAAGFAGLYNDYIADWCKQSGGRLYGMAVVPIEDVDASVGLLTRAREAGLVGVCVPPALRERNLDHRDLDRFWAAAQDLDMAVGVHGAPGVHLPKIGVDRFDNYIQVHCISFPFDMMTAMTATVTGGVFERHPRLRVAFLESGVGWVPYFLDRLHEHYEKRGSWIADGWKREPREYLDRGQIYVSCESAEPILPGVIEVLGSDFIMYASDYPHWDGEFPESSKPLRERGDVDEASRAAILGGNAARFYRLS
ncbi:MAG: amidohydrolase [Deltaproteobacteria bacterium]|nr:MAG: amidohydrolase [Deltaproteobacteria bacterium]